jgi:magnesium transporter
MSSLLHRTDTHQHHADTVPAGDLPEKAHISLIDYDTANFQEREIAEIEQCFPLKETAAVTWINIDGIDVDTILKTEEKFGIHPLVVEDIVTTGQRPKFEDYGDYIYILIKMIFFDKKINDVVSEQVSLILGKNYVLSIQETVGDIFDSIRQKIRLSKGRIRSLGPDYLAYCLLDAVVDHYFVIIEKKGDQIEKCEDRLVVNGGTEVYQEIHQLKRDLIFLRRQIWPLRDVLSGLLRCETKLIKKTTGTYLRDVYDHIVQVIDSLETYRDILSGLHDVYLSTISTKMNEIMKVLTIFASIFITLSFLAGVYGMNFEHMPWLHWRYGFYAFASIMATVALIMLLFFRRKKWL